MKKIITTVLALCLVFTMAVPAFADSGSITTAGGSSSVPVTLTTSAATFSVTVPTGFPISVSSDGTVTCASNLKIVNNSKGQIKVSSVAIEGKNSWTLVDFTTDFSKKAANTKEFGFKLEGKNVPSSGTADISSFAAIDGNGGEMALTYDANIAVQATELVDAKIADAVFTIGWNN